MRDACDELHGNADSLQRPRTGAPLCGAARRAEAAYRRALELYEESGQPEAVPFVCNNLAILRVRSIQRLADAATPPAHELEQQLNELIDRGLRLNRDGAANPMAEAMLLNTRGDALRALGRALEALPCLRHALTIYRRLDNPRGEIDAATDLAAALLEAGRVDDAIDTLAQARERLVGRDIKDHERRVEELAAEAYERRGDLAAALAHYKTFMRLTREHLVHDAQRKLLELSVRAEIDRAQRESREDPLTGVPNRRRFEEWTRTHLADAAAPYALAAVDVDRFKDINDRLSHAAGDAVLKALGQLLRRHCRDSDFVARMGGEEFVLLLRGAGAAQARDSCERLRRTVQSHPWDTVWPGTAVTVSIGVATSDGSHRLGELMQQADALLYRAKREGRNRVAG